MSETEFYYLIKEKHFTRSISILEEWERDQFAQDLASAFKGVLNALMRAGKKVKYNEKTDTYYCNNCPAANQ